MKVGVSRAELALAGFGPVEHRFDFAAQGIDLEQLGARVPALRERRLEERARLRVAQALEGAARARQLGRLGAGDVRHDEDRGRDQDETADTHQAKRTMC
jgi:hypothetical protein